METTLRLFCAGVFAVIVAAAGAGSTAQVRAEYVVEVRDTAAHLFHVTARFSNIRQPSLQLSLPIWTPGWYTGEYYGKNVMHFVVSDAGGTRLHAAATGTQTWTVDTRNRHRITVDFDYLANLAAANQGIVNGRYAFFTGTQLFVEPVGHRDSPAIVRFVTPAGWSIVSALRETSHPTTFAAASYEELVDAPTWLGTIEQHRFEVEGKPHYLVMEPGRFSADSVRAYTASLATIIRTAGAVFGGLPYEKYIFFFLPGPAQTTATVLEHGNSSVWSDRRRLPTVPAGEAHEFFHVWNVKRIRPAEMWPYDYTRPAETPSLWLAEGITRYYTDLILYRAGLWSADAFLEQIAQLIGSIEANPAAAYVSPSDASIQAWQDYGVGRPGAISYYFQGHVLGALLDLSILHDTRGQRGLDDVMRALYRDFYLRGLGYRPADVVRVVSAVAGRPYNDFFRRHVEGVEAPDYDALLGYAGVRLRRTGRVLGFLGVQHSEVAEGIRIDEVLNGLGAQLAGLRVGDIITEADGVPVRQVRMPYGCCITVNRGTERVTFTFLRDGQRHQATMILQLGQTSDAVELDAKATPDQLAVRRAWLRR